ncbi:hypothetical protein RRG08_005496 [Elysia crispata]|uniref:Uncharacterized protein n=1 Tax=Elysia crispata TaxID=231223 RepID=A0AAE0Y1H6_9GAST|nr:hypothetical protein RRG08_005496 [Elysia crispata]
MESVIGATETPVGVSNRCYRDTCWSQRVVFFKSIDRRFSQTGCETQIGDFFQGYVDSQEIPTGFRLASRGDPDARNDFRFRRVTSKLPSPTDVEEIYKLGRW